MSYAPDEAAAHPLFRADFHADPPVKTFKHFEGAHNTEMTGGIGHSMETSMSLHGGPWRSPWRLMEVSMEAHGAPWRLHGGSMEVRGDLHGGR